MKLNEKFKARDLILLQFICEMQHHHSKFKILLCMLIFFLIYPISKLNSHQFIFDLAKDMKSPKI